MHVAIIMDGNGRWAEKRGLARTLGHQAGARAVRRVVEAAAESQVDVLTLYAFSANNWSRPPGEVEALMRLFKRYLLSETARCVEHGVRIQVIGRRDRLQRELVDIIEQSEHISRAGTALLLRLAVDYSSRADILASMRGADAARTPSAEPGDAAPHEAFRGSGLIDVDLLIRTGGERRLSDFLLWECAYAELVFVDEPWPEFDGHAFRRTLAEFGRRVRRFGGLPAATGTHRTGESS
jgi:undecaprenyl diphosphate synthase